MHHLKAVNFENLYEDWYNAGVIINDVHHCFPVHNNVNITTAEMYSLNKAKNILFKLECLVWLGWYCISKIAAKWLQAKTIL